MVAAKFFLMPVPENFKKGMVEVEESSGVKINCLLTDAFLWFVGDMVKELGISWLPFWTTRSCSLSLSLSLNPFLSLPKNTPHHANKFKVTNYI